jgi:hypothetical protein
LATNDDDPAHGAKRFIENTPAKEYLVAGLPERVTSRNTCGEQIKSAVPSKGDLSETC